MSEQLVKAYLNLHAVLQNLEELVQFDEEAARAARNFKVSMQFALPRGPAVQLCFKDGRCVVRPGFKASSDIVLLFATAEHLNKVMDNKGTPILVRGLTKLPFLLRDFPKLTKRLEAVLKPTPEALNDPKFLAVHVRLLLQTAAFACAALSRWDEKCKLSASHIPAGTILLQVGNDGPAVHLVSKEGKLTAIKGSVPKPDACMKIRDIPTAQKFLSGTMDSFTAIALGDVEISGQTPMLDALSLILDRVEHFLK